MLDHRNTKIGHMLVSAAALAAAVLAITQTPGDTRDCATNPLRRVYNPQRLLVQQTCVDIDVTVEHIAKEADGDLHIRAKTDPKWINAVNIKRQHGDLVVEYMPGDPYPRPTVGERLRLTCTYVLDHQHGGWAECHPVWAVQPLGQAANDIEP